MPLRIARPFHPRMFRFLKSYALIVAIVTGVASYFALRALPLGPSVRGAMLQTVAVAQPALIFMMLLLTFCKTDVCRLRFSRWHVRLLLLQGGSFVALGAVALCLPSGATRIVVEGAMICLICPTATAAAVVTRRLGGDVAGITAYTLLINLCAAMLIPAAVPLLHPESSLSFAAAALIISGKVFPLLLLPLLAAPLLQRFAPRAVALTRRHRDLPFRLWVVSLTLATAVTARSVVHSEVSAGTIAWLTAVSAACCLLQFAVGRKVGEADGRRITGGQALGQKNTVFAIWAGYTFFTPVTAVAGGFYSIWHNVINTIQLRRADGENRKKT